MEFRRHDLVMADWPEEMVSAIPHEGLRRLVKSGRVPGIVRRDEGCDDGLGREYYTKRTPSPLALSIPSVNTAHAYATLPTLRGGTPSG